MASILQTTTLAAAIASAAHLSPARAAVTAEEAALLKTTLTPLGAERGPNKAGTIPAWTGAVTQGASLGADGRRADPFASEKPLFSVTPENMGQYADQLTEGSKALLQKYSKTFRIDVYPTHRTAVAPQWVYDNVARNALNAKLIDGGAGPMPEGAFGGVPFPIPKTGLEVMWNHALRWRPESWYWEFRGYQGTPEGKWIMVNESANDHSMPYYSKAGSAAKFAGEYWLVRSFNSGPPIRAGEAITGRLQVDESKSQAWVYLTGQRRVRKLPNACCDTPTPFSAGVISFDEVEGFVGRLDRFDWKLVGKKEVFVPYNSNRLMQPRKDSDVLATNHLNPDHVRWELHRTWVVEAALKPGQRHTSPKSRYYVDEDTWTVVMGERYDANGQLARVPFTVPMVMTDAPGTIVVSFGTYDLVSGGTYVNGLVNERKAHFKVVPPYADAKFTPDSMAAEGVR